MSKIVNDTSDNLYASEFYMEYRNFRKKIISDNLSEEEWKKAFVIERPLTEIHHPEDFE